MITQYDKYMPEASHAGKIANYQDYQADTKPASEKIPFGAALQLTADGESVSTVKTGGKPVGIALASEVHDWINNEDDQHYKQFNPVAVVRKGTIWVRVGEDVIAGEEANVNPEDGRFYAADTATVNTIKFPTAVFKTKAKLGGLAQLQINLP
ncbi:hypothetical protein NCCP2716_27720 [Sporosarcina sp. NCCP-2716]|uniref:structural cement protein Gp24 n=1 Tax=Sporosarcina sp. NCCP-2716 TaxID=2943679 RepID=UPI00203D7A29|nr:hypothetical protein [Sporosarcina sp. NCCP-2716]GKV70274.1 hypothetical protein NCCP2716_27720 [Sporosarcina sp. NCCP-2716]